MAWQWICLWLDVWFESTIQQYQKRQPLKTKELWDVLLLPADTSVGWFHEAIQTASEVRFITAGRLAKETRLEK